VRPLFRYSPFQMAGPTLRARRLSAHDLFENSDGTIHLHDRVRGEITHSGYLSSNSMDQPQISSTGNGEGSRALPDRAERRTLPAGCEDGNRQGPISGGIGFGGFFDLVEFYFNHGFG